MSNTMKKIYFLANLVALYSWSASGVVVKYRGLRASGNTTQGHDPTVIAKTCSAHPQCQHLAGDCCPTKEGVMLDCCPKAENPAQCSVHAKCNDLGLTGECCPTKDNVMLDCCDKPNAESPAMCSKHAKCNALGLAGECCPTKDGTMLDCCKDEAQPQPPAQPQQPAQPTQPTQPQASGPCEDFCASVAHGEMGDQDNWKEICSDPGMIGHCGGCAPCQDFCPQSWKKDGKKCYTLQPANTDYDNAKKWCTDQGANLVSIHSEQENKFLRNNVCGTESCWIGLTEKAGTGDKATTQADQKWVWADGSDLNAYKNWKLWGGPFDEPNNWGCPGGKCSYGQNDERYTFMNLPHGGNNGNWYDAPKMHQAKAICEVPTGTTVQAPPPSKCPMGWTDFKEKCYTASPAKQNWEASKTWCEGNGADLVSINSADENEIVRTVCGTQMCWLGLSEKPGTGTKDTTQAQQRWVWNDGTDLASYSNWKQWGGKNSEPNNWGKSGANNHDERKGFINWASAGFAGSWYDGPASMDGFAICEKTQQLPSMR